MATKRTYSYVPFTAEDLYEACLEVYADGEHAPYQAWVDTIGDDVVIVRVSYPDEFCHKCAARLETLRISLHARFGHLAAITFIIYGSDLDALGIKKRSARLQSLFLDPGV